MKKWLLIISATVICVAAAFLYFFSLTPKGDTITSRESILNTAISKGNEWTIAKELELGGYIVSGAYSADNKSTLAIFEPASSRAAQFRRPPVQSSLPNGCACGRYRRSQGRLCREPSASACRSTASICPQRRFRPDRPRPCLPLSCRHTARRRA